MIEQEDLYKKQAAAYALDSIKDGMRLGLGTGSTANFVLELLAERLREGQLRDIAGVPTSETTAARARQLGIPLITLADSPTLDLALDGADEIDSELTLIKGLGGALLREKIVARSATRFIVIGAASKQVAALGVKTPVPVEIIEFARPVCTRWIAASGARPVLRTAADGSAFRTDEGHVILDCHFDGIADAEALGQWLHSLPGVVEHGLFVGMAELAIIAGPDGVREIVPASQR
jgi:ribose 5-phosphate isomerase A